MRPAEPERDYRELVKQTYDLIAEDYSRGRFKEADDARFLAPLVERLAPDARVLDLGCGAGVPITRALAEHCDVTGVDFSLRQLALARTQVPRARFVQADIVTCEFSPGSFDAVVSFFAIFHVPRENHADLFRRIQGWLKPGGYFLATFALDDEAGYTEGDYFGREMFWSNYGIDQYRRLLAETGFEVRDAGIIADDPATGVSPERHPVVFAQKA